MFDPGRMNHKGTQKRSITHHSEINFLKFGVGYVSLIHSPKNFISSRDIIFSDEYFVKEQSTIGKLKEIA